MDLVKLHPNNLDTHVTVLEVDFFFFSFLFPCVTIGLFTHLVSHFARIYNVGKKLSNKYTSTNPINVIIYKSLFMKIIATKKKKEEKHDAYFQLS